MASPSDRPAARAIAVALRIAASASPSILLSQRAITFTIRTRTNSITVNLQGYDEGDEPGPRIGAPMRSVPDQAAHVVGVVEANCHAVHQPHPRVGEHQHAASGAVVGIDWRRMPTVHRSSAS